MPALTQQQAQQYYNTLPAGEKARVDAIGGPSVQWLSNAVDAGVPDAISAVGGRQTYQGEGWRATGGIAGRGGNTKDWAGKRKPTPSELRVFAREQGYSEDYERFDDRQLAAWINESWDVGAGSFRGGFEKPTDDPRSLARGGGGGGGGRGGGRGGGGGSLARGASGTYAGAPAFSYPDFVPPSYEDAISDPGYQFALGEGQRALTGSAAARGTLLTSGTLKDLIDYGQEAGAQQYQNVWDREAAKYGINRDTARDIFAPEYGSWQSAFGAGENRWQTKYGGNLSKYLQREQNIYGLLSQPPPTYGGY